jgi:hypothetical protein
MINMNNFCLLSVVKALSRNIYFNPIHYEKERY